MMRDALEDAASEVLSRQNTIVRALHMAVTNHAIDMPDYLKAAYDGWVAADQRLQRAREAYVTPLKESVRWGKLTSRTEGEAA